LYRTRGQDVGIAEPPAAVGGGSGMEMAPVFLIIFLGKPARLSTSKMIYKYIVDYPLVI